jgi:hypothetical protein
LVDTATKRFEDTRHRQMFDILWLVPSIGMRVVYHWAHK